MGTVMVSGQGHVAMWTVQEYVAGPSSRVNWGVAAVKLQAPAPATLSSAGPGVIGTGQTSVTVEVTGTSVNGSGFYDTPSSLSDPCRTRLTATVSGGVTVNGVSYVDPTHVQLNLSTVGAALGPQTVTITNPDGQSVAAALLRLVNRVYLPLVRH